MKLIIAAEKNAGFAVGAAEKGKLIDWLEIDKPFKQSELLLITIEKLLKQRKIVLSQLDGIIIAAGPGEFSALRTGIATANALGYALNIKVAGVKLSKEFIDQKSKLEFLLKKGLVELKKKKLSMVMPFYDREPNISLSKLVS